MFRVIYLIFVVLLFSGCATNKTTGVSVDPSSIVLRLAVQNGCRYMGEVKTVKKEGNVETFSIPCSSGEMKFQCDFQGEIEFGGDGVPYNRVYGKSYQLQPACWQI